MTPRERVLAALRHEEPDRIPYDLGGTESSGITALAYNRLRRHLGLPPGQTRVYDVYQQIAQLEPDLRAVLKPDTVPLLLEPARWRPFTLSDGSACQIPESWRPEKEPDGSWAVRDGRGAVVARMPAGGYYFEPALFPCAEAQTPGDLARHEREIAAYDWPSFADEGWEALTARARALHEEGDLAVVANLQLHLLAAGQYLRGYEAFMMDLLTDPGMAHALLGRLTEAYLARCDDYLGRVGRYVDVVLVNDDLGTQNGPMLSLDCYRDMIWPYQKKLFGHIKSRCDARILFHSCGSVRAFIPSLIDAGVDALNPVQVSAAGMDTAGLKRDFGRDLTFWGGGCDTQSVLPRGPVGRIRDEVRRRVSDLGSGGGFVFCQVHNLQPDVPPGHVLAMLEAFRECHLRG